MSNDTIPEWLTMKEFGDLTQTSESSVKRLRAKGKIPFQYFGRLVRIPRAALDFDWLQRWRNENLR